MLACQRASSALRTAQSIHQCVPLQVLYPAPVAHRRAIRSRASSNDKSWGDIASEAVEVVKDVAKKVTDTATSALQSIIPGSKAAAPTRQQQQQRGPIYRREDDRPLPMQMPGGFLGGLMGSVINSAVQGLAKEMEKTAEATRSVAEVAADRISSSRRVKQRLGQVTVGLPMSQSVATQSINGRVSKTVNLLLPVYNAAGAPVAQAQVIQSEGQYQDTTRITVRLPGGDSINLDEDDSSSRTTVSGRGDIIDAEFRDIK